MATLRTRREPPAFRPARVGVVQERSPWLRRLTLVGEELVGFPAAGPAASVRLVLPPAGRDEVVLPGWFGNEFLYEDGSRPHIRTLTPMRIDPDAGEVDVDIVVHDGVGRMADFAATAEPGLQVGLAGTGRGHTIDVDVTHHLLAGDESALPAIATLLDDLPRDAAVRVVVEVAQPDARLELPAHPRLEATWVDKPADAPPGTALADAVLGLELADDERVWAAGEAASVQRIRRHLFETLGLPRTRGTVRGYWKHGRSGDADDAD